MPALKTIEFTQVNNYNNNEPTTVFLDKILYFHPRTQFGATQTTIVFSNNTIIHIDVDYSKAKAQIQAAAQ
jgi:hypothetical protein